MNAIVAQSKMKYSACSCRVGGRGNRISENGSDIHFTWFPPSLQETIERKFDPVPALKKAVRCVRGDDGGLGADDKARAAAARARVALTWIDILTTGEFAIPF
ncbi:MAG: hypothetical protein AB1586_10350 [Pseudomonadota bacterium]